MPVLYICLKVGQSGNSATLQKRHTVFCMIIFNAIIMSNFFNNGQRIQTFLREQERVIIGMKETFNRKKMAMKTHTTPSPMMKRVL